MESSNPKRLKMSEEGSSSTSTEEKPYFTFASSNFNDIVRMEAFVDKTLLIKTIFENTEMIVITAPRRFGKSSNMNMVKKFVEIQVDASGAVIQKDQSSNYNIFKNNNLLIYQNKKFFDKYFATYPVIHVNFKSISGKTFDSVLEDFRTLLWNTFGQYGYLLQSGNLGSREKSKFRRYYEEKSCRDLTQTDIKVGLGFLSECLYKHFNNKEVFVLIDEYDAPINNTMFKKDIDVDEVNELLCAIFSNALKDTDYVGRALLTGISYFATVGLSGANNIKTYKFLDKHRFVRYYGLTEREVAYLLTKFQIDDETKVKVTEHYNGYLSLGGTKLFSIWSVLNFLQEREIKNYWTQSGVVSNLEEALKLHIVRYHIEKFCKKESLDIQIIDKVEISHIVELRNVCLQKPYGETKVLKNPDLYFFFILQQGYLTYDADKVPDNPKLSELNAAKVPDIPKLCAVKAANDEIIDELRNKLTEFYGTSVNLHFSNCAVIFDNISVSSDDEIFKDFVSKFNNLISASDSNCLQNSEAYYHGLMFTILCRTKFSIATEYCFSGGRADLILSAGNIGIIIEMKYHKSSGDALEQILSKYLIAFDNEIFKTVTDKIYMGINITENRKVEVGVLVKSVKIEDAKYFR